MPRVQGLHPLSEIRNHVLRGHSEDGSRHLSPQIVLLFIVGFVGLPGLWPRTTAGAAQESWEAILRHFTSRLPVVIPLVWLAIYAGRHYTIALRVQEEYAFKEAVSTAFEGSSEKWQAFPIQQAVNSHLSRTPMR